MKKILTMDFGASTDVGRTRDENQDTFGIFPAGAESVLYSKGRLFVVADGMGGHKGGRVASELAVKVIGQGYFSNEDESVQASLVNAIRAANEAVFSAGKEDAALSGMGTTCVAVVVSGSSAFVAHIGDSRLYRVTRDSVFQVTEDHTAVAEMQRRGILTAEEARNHPDRSVLYRALGTKPEATPDVQPEIIIVGEEWFVLCTDGLSNMVDETEIRDIVVAHSPKNACDLLVSLANERGGYDNITVIVVRVTGS